MISRLPLKEAIEVVRSARPVGDSFFSVTTSVSGSRHFNNETLHKVAVSEVGKSWKLRHLERDRSNLDLRIFADGKRIDVSLRLSAQSLHHRGYQKVPLKGSLRPTIAAAMLRLIGATHKGITVVDSFCGSGTILAEAHMNGCTVFGGDIEETSVRIACKTLAGICLYDVKDQVIVGDACHTPWKQGAFDRAVSNLPWGNQVAVSNISKLYEGTMKEYARIVKEKGAICVLVSKADLLSKYARRYFPGAKISQLKLGYLGQSPTIVAIERAGRDKESVQARTCTVEEIAHP